jgi:hypothetical protein
MPDRHIRLPFSCRSRQFDNLQLLTTSYSSNVNLQPILKMAAKAGGSFFSSAAGKEWRNYLMSAFAITFRSLSNVYPADLTYL